MKNINKNITVTVVGLGYVGLPLALEFGRRYRTFGYDLSDEKIINYKNLVDPTGELSAAEFAAAKYIEFSSSPQVIAEADIIIIAVPTPVDQAHSPDFRALRASSITVGKHMKSGSIIVYESTVYPGATEEICVPILEKYSGMKWRHNFHIGYSPERVNPGDKDHTITEIVKVVSGDDEATLETLSELYESVIKAGIHRASSIKVAEAAKVIENTQRDLNIALMNELAIIFGKIGIDTYEVIEAAKSKWNFVPFYPGLVGGHCIGVDPYYLTYKAEMLGYHPQVILAGRRINDFMAAYIAKQTIKHMINADINIKSAKILILGLTFKENCSDIRNSKVSDLVKELCDYGSEIFVHDPLADAKEALKEYDIKLSQWDQIPQVDAIIYAVPHNEYRNMEVDQLLKKLKTGSVFIDVKSACVSKEISNKGYILWRL